MIRTLLVLIFIFIPWLVQSQDLIILRNGERVECNITKVDSTTLYYKFIKEDRTLSSFINKSNARSYQINDTPNSDKSPADTLNSTQKETVIVDTSDYLKETQDWVNLITYSTRLGMNAKGWSLKYYGYNLTSTKKSFVPLIAGYEGFRLDDSYFSQYTYQSMDMSYFTAEISPFFRLTDYMYLKIGVQLLFGEERLKYFLGEEKTNSIYGIAPSQGIYFISRSNAGIVVGISAYEKLMNSEVYERDIGLNFEIGIKF